MENLYLSTSIVQWRQTSLKVPSAHAQVEVAAQTTVLAVRTVYVAQSCHGNENCGNPQSVGDLDIPRDTDEDDSAA